MTSPAQPPGRAPNQLVFDDLTDYPVMAQALDNQWLPAALAATRQRTGAVPGPSPEAVATAAAELRRALVNSGTLIVNRAFFLNNEAVYANYLPDADAAERTAFIRLLDSRVLVPYLFTEREPAGEFTWGYDRSVHQAWTRLVSDEADPGLVRFDWDDAANLDVADGVGVFFAGQISGLKNLQHRQLARDLGISEEQALAMKEGVLTDIAVWAAPRSREQITRNAIYKEFITRPGTDPYLNLLREGPHVVPTKQLVDLVYNLGVPTVAGAIPLTPPDSPLRSTLQELRTDSRPRAEDPEAIGHLLRDVFADALHRAVDGPNSYAELSLADIVRLRREEEWRGYVDSLDGFVRGGFRAGRLPSPEEFAAGTSEVARRHARMLRTARKTSGNGGGFTRELAAVLVLESAGIALQVTGGEDVSLLSGATTVLTAAAGVLTMRVEFREKGTGGSLLRRRGGLGHSLTLPAMRLGSLRRDWETILRTYRAAGGRIVEVPSGTDAAARQADQQPEGAA
ncbi:hypothetical protein ACIQUQ_30590 [Streptomyces sp. NPDC101118]|uniref:hypothetical protein n=1 Tax=Streptomyces sp. NPDC101118 TaxID=3366109 RepID=UPI003821E2C1